MNARYLVVDGHSVIFAWTDLRSLHARNRASARRALAEQLQRLHDTTTWRVTLVLDGKLGTVLPTAAKAKDMVICYATADQTADSIIERLVVNSGKAAEILVITADEAEKLTVESCGARTASPDWLRDELRLEDAAFDASLAKVHRSAKW